ncbi:DUF2269 family protein [Commensalibacter oyaizuii]|uniref:DUF2269 family protein n=1 Tax=Commensalibacter oyaizuii TaxID=3043873 RepID=A0ABT6Q2A5_9PROT|nr:DUF2269 family protein [Commensalibacter sp. TBRC 16381]MDI2091247.1 DUF2269 family protein [Commensalibacter sp. TBRC 16381]
MWGILTLKTLHVLCAIMVTGMGFGIFVHTCLLLNRPIKQESLYLQVVSLLSGFILFVPAIISLLISGFFLASFEKINLTEPWIVSASLYGGLGGTIFLCVAYFCLAMPFQHHLIWLKIGRLCSFIGWGGFMVALLNMILKRSWI